MLTPRIQGEAVLVPPLQIFLAGGEIAGLAGAALAVPTVAVLRVLAGYFAARLHVRRGDGMNARPAPARHRTNRLEWR